MCQSSPSLTILVPLWFIVMSLVFFHLCKALFLGFLQVKGTFVDGQNTSKVRDEAPLISKGNDIRNGRLFGVQGERQFH